MTAETNRYGALLADEQARNERLLMEWRHRGFTLIERTDHEELTVITARDIHGRVWTSVNIADGFDWIIDPDGSHIESWQPGCSPEIESWQPGCSPVLSDATTAFIDWLIRGEY